MKLKIFLISFLISLPFWWTMDVLEDSLAKSPEFFTADLSQKIKEQREQRQRFNNLELEAESAIVAEITPKGNVKFLFEKNPEKPLPIASISKLMTALVVFDLKESYNLSLPIKITKEAVNQEGVSKFRELNPGELVPVKELVYKMLIESSNDAAFALTEPIGEDGFVALMNIYAKEIGLSDTFFLDPTGLKKNTSTARELVKLANYILENYPQIFEITTYRADQNTNKLLKEIPEIVGGKTGWTQEARGCLILVLKNRRNGYFVNVVLGSEHRFNDMRKIIKTLNI